MSRFYIEDPEQIYGCFRCGELMGDVTEVGHGHVCGSCGEDSVISLLNSLDIINDLFLKGDLTLNGEDIYLNDIIE